GQLPRPKADLVSAAAHRPRQRRFAARNRAPRIRCVALARVLGATRNRDRIQARGVPACASRARALHSHEVADAPRTALRLLESYDAVVVRGNVAQLRRLTVDLRSGSISATA